MEPENNIEPEKSEFRNDTPVNAPVKEKFRIEMRKIREMRGKKKFEYIWGYYKFHILVLVGLLVLAGSIINSVFINPRPQNVLFVAWSTGFATEEQLSDLKDVLNERIIEPKANETIEIAMFFQAHEDPSMDAAQIQRLAAMIAAGMIDVFIIDTEMLEDYIRFGYLHPMEEILSDIRRQNPTIYNRITENAIRTTYTSFEGVTSENIMGIDITKNRILNELGFFEFDKIFTLSVTASHPENVTKALMALFE